MVYGLRSWRPLHRLRGPPPPLWQGRLEIRSVPLRGYGFEMIVARMHNAMEEMVSVPLRGYGFEMTELFFISAGGLSFRPLAGIWF